MSKKRAERDCGSSDGTELPSMFQFEAFDRALDLQGTRSRFRGDDGKEEAGEVFEEAVGGKEALSRIGESEKVEPGLGSKNKRADKGDELKEIGEVKFKKDKQLTSDVKKVVEGSKGAVPKSVSNEEKRIRDAAPVDSLVDTVKKVTADRDRLLKKLEEHKKVGAVDLYMKVQLLEKQVFLLQQQVDSNSHCIQEAMLKEKEKTGQSNEDLHKQNLKLLQELMKKNDAYIKVRAEKMKSDKLLNLERKEKDLFKNEVSKLKNELLASNLVVSSMEDKGQVLQDSLAFVQNDTELQGKVMEEMHKRMAVASAQSATEFNLNLSICQALLKETLQLTADSSQEKAILQELEEYEKSSTCTLCHINSKNAVLIKCFHMFCYDCLHLRYRKKKRTCPKCNINFEGNGYHRINFNLI